MYALFFAGPQVNTPRLRSIAHTGTVRETRFLLFTTRLQNEFAADNTRAHEEK